MESLLAVVDIFFISRLNDNDAVTAVGLTESVNAIVYSLAMGLGMAATAMVARRIGEKNPEAATKAGMQSILVSLIITICLSIPGVIYAPDILRIMGAEPAAVALGTGYTRIIMGASIAIMLLFLINGIFRGAGDAMMAMKSLWLANICNIILCPVLIRGFGPIPAFGLIGAAMAAGAAEGLMSVSGSDGSAFGCLRLSTLRSGSPDLVYNAPHRLCPEQSDTRERDPYPFSHKDRPPQ